VASVSFSSSRDRYGRSDSQGCPCIRWLREGRYALRWISSIVLVIFLFPSYAMSCSCLFSLLSSCIILMTDRCLPASKRLTSHRRHTSPHRRPPYHPRSLQPLSYNIHTPDPTPRHRDPFSPRPFLHLPLPTPHPLLTCPTLLTRLATIHTLVWSILLLVGSPVPVGSSDRDRDTGGGWSWSLVVGEEQSSACGCRREEGREVPRGTRDPSLARRRSCAEFCLR
jgi:hypothetical protein